MFRHIAKKYSLRKVAPNSIPMSLPRCEENDFFSVYIDIEELNIKILCKKELSNGIEGFLWVDETDGAEACLLKSVLNSFEWKLKIEHYYKGWVFKYESPFLFCISILFQKHKFIYRRDKLEQIIFNNKTLIRAERIRVLEYVLEKTTENQKYITDPLYFGMELYSKRWLFHPDNEVMKNHYKLVFESLVESGDLIKEQQTYKLSPKALNTISEYEREEQRHFDSQNSARKTRNLTKAIIILGLLNLVFQVIKWVYESKISP